MKKKHVIIVGAGASGLMAGIMAARSGQLQQMMAKRAASGKAPEKSGSEEAK